MISRPCIGGDAAPVHTTAPRIFSPEYYQRLARWEQDHPWAKHMQLLALALLERYGAGAPQRALDAGCGAGHFTLLWCERHRIPVTVGLDYSCDGLRLGQQRGLRLLAAGTLSALPLRSASFDAVHCGDVLQHLAEDRAAAAMGEFARVLRSGGILVIRTAARRGLGAKKHRDSPEYRQWEPAALRAGLERCGLRVEWMSKVNWLPSLAADLDAWARPAPEGDPGLPPPELPRGPRRRLLEAYWRLEAAALLRLAWRLPGGHTLLCLARKP